MAEEVTKTKGQASEAEFRPADRITITSLDTVKVLSDPLRMQILEEMLAAPTTVKQLASRLSMSPTKLYYHINMLEEHGIVKVVSTRVVSGIIEKQYWVTASSFELDRELLSPTGSGMSDPVNDLLRTIFDGVRTDLNRSVKAGLVDLSKPSGTSPEEEQAEGGDRQMQGTMLVRNVVRLPRERAREFARRMSELVKEFCTDSSEDPDDPIYGMLLVLYPTLHAHPSVPEKADMSGNE